MQKNVLIVSIDCARTDTIGYSRSIKRATMPNLVEFQEGATVYSNCFCNATCTPGSHATMLTGLLPPRHGIRKMYSQKLSPRATMIQERLPEDYTTVASVNALGLSEEYGMHRGFGAYYNHPSASKDPEAVINKLLSLLEGVDGSWFALLHLFTAHGISYPSYKEHKLGLEKIDQFLPVLFERTEGALTFITGDHGDDIYQEHEGDHGEFVFDTTMRVPLLVRYPEWTGVNSCSHSSQMVQHADLVPSILSCLGLQSSDELDGNEIFAGSKNWIYCEAPKTGAYCVRFSDMKVVWDGEGELDGVYHCNGSEVKCECTAGGEAILERAKVIAHIVREGKPVATPHYFEDPDLEDSLRKLGYVT